MENASKALIIAGAILLSILIISLGIMIFNQAQDAMGNGGMSEAEISTFNNKFIKYEGNNKRGSTVKNLIQEVNINNAQEDAYQIELAGDAVGSANADGSYSTSDIGNTKYYNIKTTSDKSKGGRITKIEINEVSSN